MHADNFSLKDYFARIGYAGPTTPEIGTVARMMQRQLYSVPFENLDVQAGKIVSLVPEEIVDKIVHRKRGGYCYEVNGLFSMALEALNIPHQLVAARPMIYPARRPRTHMAIVVALEGERWLCDLGFGSSAFVRPCAFRHSTSRFARITTLSNSAPLMTVSTCCKRKWMESGQINMLSTCRRRNGSISFPQTI